MEIKKKSILEDSLRTQCTKEDSQFSEISEFFFFLLSYSYCHLFPQCCYVQVSPLVQFNLVAQSWLTVTPWTAECWASLSICNSKSLLKLMFIQSVMPTIHPILCSPSSSYLQSLPASGFFLMSQLFTSGC